MRSLLTTLWRISPTVIPQLRITANVCYPTLSRDQVQSRENFGSAEALAYVRLYNSTCTGNTPAALAQ
eukprot:13280489-Heterocapsa_arctica.AAC.1